MKKFSSALKSKKMLLVCLISGLGLLNSSNTLAVAETLLPTEVCKAVYANDCSELNEESTGAQYVDLNGDKTNELILAYGGGSCGANYWVFKLGKDLKWKELGGWCGCEDEKFKIKKSQHNGYKVIWSCGYTGFFDGKEYIGKRQ